MTKPSRERKKENNRANRHLEIRPETAIVSRHALFRDSSDEEEEERGIDEDAVKRLSERIQRDVLFSEITSAMNIDNDDNKQVFRLFAREPPTLISLHSSVFDTYNEKIEMMRHGDRYEMSNDSERDKRVAAACITYADILRESRIPWERHFFPQRRPLGGYDHQYGWIP
ncbi:3538_t:CDS:2 [Ambispora gerdemannii]|uniref:3538_t:CDS:1 n=1 Tax=Ambispora gerdemannii TaxID=144530 RepID=A0A9N9FLU2_9GLOM|nr:3538_t:CDS:2 [Ambispora gerdemannii]